MQETTEIVCPCCGDPMGPRNVVCWGCWKSSDRLTPGEHWDMLNPHGWTLTAEMVARFEQLRAERLGWIKCPSCDEYTPMQPVCLSCANDVCDSLGSFDLDDDELAEAETARNEIASSCVFEIAGQL